MLSNEFTSFVFTLPFKRNNCVHLVVVFIFNPDKEFADFKMKSQIHNTSEYICT